MREIIRNIPEHAEIEDFWYCAQNYPKKGYSEIVIANEGVGVYENLKSNYRQSQYFATNLEALKWALKPGISVAFDPEKKQKKRDKWENSGYGLYVVSNICKELNGMFYLISKGNYIKADSQGMISGETDFNGTAIIMHISNKNIKNIDSIIENIRIRGEEEAQELKTSFKKASKPSNGTMKR